MSQSLIERDLRQRELVPPERLAAVDAVVVGVGAIGRQVAWQLAAIGIRQLTLIDHDTVDVVNLAPQGYAPTDLGRPKVEATADACRYLNPEVQIQTMPERFRRSMSFTSDAYRSTVLFCCVDSIVTRRLIWESVRSQAALFIDGRMSAEVIRVLAVSDCYRDTAYQSTLFTAEQAHVGRCTARSTLYTASIAAGLMLSQFTRWLRDLPIDRDCVLNLLSMEMTTG